MTTISSFIIKHTTQSMYVNSCVLFITDADFNTTSFTITIPRSDIGVGGEPTVFHDIEEGVPNSKFMIEDDNVDEVTQSFALVAVVVGIPEDVKVCVNIRNQSCIAGRTTATEIEIADNDGMSLKIISIVIIQS